MVTPKVVLAMALASSLLPSASVFAADDVALSLTRAVLIVERRAAVRDRFDVVAEFHVPTDAGGADPGVAPVSVSVGPFTQIIPSSAFALRVKRPPANAQTEDRRTWAFKARPPGVTRLRLERTRDATGEHWALQVRARRVSLQGTHNPVLFELRIGADRATVAASLRVGETRTRTTFRFPAGGAAGFCGDGTMDPGEQCEPTTDGSEDCCSSSCQLEPTGTVCRSPAGICDAAEVCTGAGAVCPSDRPVADGTPCPDALFCNGQETCSNGSCRPASTPPCPPEACVEATDSCGDSECGNGETEAGEDCDPGADIAGDCCTATCRFAAASVQCRPAAGVCDVAETCTGASGACPADAVAPGGECRPSAGPCDVAEACAGASPACPADGFAGSGTPCRPAVDVCDRAETCSGAAATCPADAKAADGTACSDPRFCNGAETCQSGSCSPATPPCSADDCDEDQNRCGECGNDVVEPGEDCEPPSGPDACPGGLTCSATCTCPVVTPIVAITSPPNLQLFSSHAVTVAGTTQNAISVECAGVPAALAQDGSFQAAITLREGRNPISCVARSITAMAAVDTVQLVADTTPPTVVIEAPPAGFMTASSQIDVGGAITDATSAAVQAVQPVVTVNGVQANVANRSFVVPGFLLQPGINTIAASATDAAGNVGTAEITVTLLADAPEMLQELSGNGQSARAGEALGEPLAVRLVDRRGNPVPGRPVTFLVSRGDGVVGAFPDEARTVSVPTDDSGIARVTFKLGQRVGGGNHQVTANVTGVPTSVVFCASAEGLPPRRIVVEMGGNQMGAVGTNLPIPLLALVTDTLGNPAPGVPVTFEVVQGGGALGGAPTVVKATDTEGRASAVLTLGPAEGISNNIVNASFAGLTESPATFVASALVTAPEPNTTVSGLVLDNQDDPVPGVTAHLHGTNLTAVADDQGRFTITNVPVGAALLVVDGTTTSRPGSWPVLDFPMVLVSGRDNTTGMPIRLLPLDVDGGKIVGGPEDVTIQMRGVPGAELTVFANSATFHGGAKTGLVSFTQVHTDKVPMLAPLGSSFMLAFSVQPPGAHFDPPARIAIPNMGSPAGHVVEMFSFDHDIFEFVSIGTATTTADGAQMVSDPGFGITKAGWGGCVPPPPPPKCTLSCDDRDECTGDIVRNPPCACENPPANEGGTCGNNQQGTNSCRDSGVCENGSCSGMMRPDESMCDDGRHCTQPDKCEDGTCKGEKVEKEVLDSQTIELQSINSILQNVQQWFGLLQIQGVTIPKFEGQIVFSEQKECCDEVVPL